MVSILIRRAQKAGLSERIEVRQAGIESLGVADFSGKVDFVVALHMVHEVPDQASFFSQVWSALKPKGQLLVVEPKGHVSRKQLAQTVAVAENAGFKTEGFIKKLGGRGALLIKPSV